MKICPITQSNQHQSNYVKSFNGHFPIDGGGGAKLVPELYMAKKTVEGTSLFGWVAAGFAAVIGLGALLAHKIDKNLVNTGDLDINDIYNPEMYRMYM